jgi:hypothetical protein
LIARGLIFAGKFEIQWVNNLIFAYPKVIHKNGIDMVV